MPDDKRKSGGQDRKLIGLSEDYEVGIGRRSSA